ncbi:acyl carrier protein [Ponticoccus sp. (in: a-proteobacteria)]|uniref:acyl carrier protein n=1 Tax=Ponticoccus sp. (in: a-proteobacteria) TaxID=1925025 RepID=UPI003AB623A9
MSSDLSICVERAFKTFFPDAEVSQDSDFFDLGGDSLKAVELCSLIGQLIHAEVHPSLLFSHATPAEVTEALRREYGPL